MPLVGLPVCSYCLRLDTHDHVIVFLSISYFDKVNHNSSYLFTKPVHKRASYVQLSNRSIHNFNEI